MIARPAAAALSGMAAVAVVALDALIAYRRNHVATKTYASNEVVNTGITLSTSARLYELTTSVPLHDVSPDLIANTIRLANATLLDQAFQRMTALDWVTFRSHIFEQPKDGVAQIIVRVDVL